MTDEDALLAAIAANPDDDTPRLVYADWLDEHDRHVRAEFIRVQIDVARKETLPRVIQNRYVDVWRRNQELIDNHRAELLGPLTGLPWTVPVEFRRGFMAEVTLPVDLFLRVADLIAALRPRPKVGVTGAAAMPGAFLACPHLDCVTGLAVYADEPDRGALAEPGLPLGESARLRNLESADLEGCGVGDWVFGWARAATVGDPEPFPALTDLDLSNNLITDAGVIDLLGTPFPRRLKRLILGGNPIADQGAIELADRWPRGADDRLQYLNLKFTDIGRAGQQALLARFGGRVDLF